MDFPDNFDQGTPSQRLTILSGLLELALHAPEGEVTFEGRRVLQYTARQIVLLSSQVIETGAALRS